MGNSVNDVDFILESILITTLSGPEWIPLTLKVVIKETFVDQLDLRQSLLI